MRDRSIDEIKQDISNYQDMIRAKTANGFCRKTMRWRTSEMRDEVSWMIRHVKNLRLELNRANQRRWPTRQRRTPIKKGKKE